MSGYDMHLNDQPAYGMEGEYLTDLLTNQALDEIQRHDPNRPLYMQINHLAPHAPLDVPNEYSYDEELRHINDPNRRAYASEFDVTAVIYKHSFGYFYQSFFFLLFRDGHETR